jgi:diguanylate cyclase (GGDEF)-like protein
MAKNKAKSSSLKIFNVLIIFTGLLTFIGVSGVYRIGKYTIEKNIASMQEIDSMSTNMGNIDQYMLYIVSGLNVSKNNTYLENINLLIEKNEKTAEAYKVISNDTSFTDMERRRYNQCRLGIITYDKKVNEIVGKIENGNFNDAKAIYEQEFTPAKACLIELLDAVSELNQRTSEQRLAYNYWFYVIVTVILALATILSVIVVTNNTKRNQQFTEEIAEKTNELHEANASMKSKDEKLTYLAYYDILTGLPNRYLFTDEVKKRIKTAPTEEFTVVVLDVDNFRQINDTYGYNMGDALLVEYAKRMSAFCGKEYTLARISGNEFGVLIPEPKSRQEIINCTEVLRNMVSTPVNTGGVALATTASCGIVTYPRDAAESEEILKLADIAVHKAKEDGKNRVYFMN